MADSNVHSNPDTPGLRPNRACRNCVQIKARCVALEGSDLRVCQRCHRLQKTCTTAAPALRKKAKHQRSSNRVAQLEKRLDEVTSVLTAIQKNPSPGGNPASLPTPITLPATSPQADHQPPNIFGDNPVDSQGYVDYSQLIPQPDSEMEQRVFGEFIEGMNYFFPFVMLPTSESAATLRRTRPYLYRACVFAAARRYPVWQRQLAEGILRHIGEGMLVYGERSLDLLQSLLVFLSWYHYHGHINPQLMNLMHLCLSLIVDLGLGSSSSRFQSANTITTDAERIIHGKAVARGVKTNEERRAVLACYYYTTTYSFCFHRLDYLKFSPHLDQCCKDLSASAEYASDQAVVAIVKLHQLVERYIMHLDTKPGTPGNLPLSMYVKLFRQDLRAHLQTIPQEAVMCDEFFTLHLHSAEVCFYESIIPIHCDNNCAIDKVEALHSCLLAVQTYFTSFLSQYSTDMPSIPYFYWMRIIHSLSVLTKLSFLQLEGWDLQYVRSTVKFCDLIDKLNEKLWQVQETESAHQRLAFSKRFRAYRAKLEKCKFWFTEMVAQEEKAKAQDAEAGAQEGAVDFNDPVFAGMLENLDEYLNFDFMEGWPENAQV